jgi:DNA-directed RNA polymerase specialized sigma24 family protein
MPRPADREARHRAALEFGRQLAEHRWPVPLRAHGPQNATPAERLLLARDWPRLEDAYELLDARGQIALDLAYGLRPGDGRVRSEAEIAEALGVATARVPVIVRRAIGRLDDLIADRRERRATR